MVVPASKAKSGALTRGVHIIVATPGRLIDLIKRGTVSLENVRTVVLDEADEMLNMGFAEDIDEILSNVPDERGMLLFSATMPQEIAKITRNYMNKPVEITIGRKNEGPAMYAIFITWCIQRINTWH